MTIWYSLCSFNTFFRFWYHAPRKVWHPWLPQQENATFTKIIFFSWIGPAAPRRRSKTTRMATNSSRSQSASPPGSGRACPGADPTKHDFPNLTHSCKFFSQTCVKCFTNLWKNWSYQIWVTIYKSCLVFFTNILKNNWHIMIVKIALPENIV
jgi:hypothetical protein